LPIVGTTLDEYKPFALGDRRGCLEKAYHERLCQKI